MSKLGSKILILVPAKTARGGITNYYQVLRDEFPQKVQYFERGARTWPYRKGVLQELIRAYRDYNRFKKKIRNEKINLVQSTTSLGLSTTIRDGLFLRYSRRSGIKTVAFFRGWDELVERKIGQRHLRLFKYFFFQSDALIVLSEQIKKTLQNWGYKGDIYVETTLVDKHLMKDISEEHIVSKYNGLEKTMSLNLLFLSRVEKRKGIYEFIDAYLRIKASSSKNYTATICGDGFELEPLREKIKTEKIEGIEVVGFVTGKQKKSVFKESHIFVFPSHGEGMPNAVLEAMGFGLPVITTPVGGLIDFFKDGKNGFLTPINNIEKLTENIENLAAQQELMKSMALNNYSLANSIFRSDRVAEGMLTIFEKIIESS